jgi:L-serine dehydratase
MHIFDILGPIMVGPSSSHTAGAVRIGLMARALLGSTPTKATIGFHGSFAATGKGHGTDRAVVAGLLGMRPDDMRIPNSFTIAKEEGIDFSIRNIKIPGAHPNTIRARVTDAAGKTVELQASSLGGGRIMVNKLDGILVNCTGENPTLVIYNQDQPGYVATVTSALAREHINIATLQLRRGKRGGEAVMIIEIDQRVPSSCISWLEAQDGILRVIYIEGVD